MGASSMLLKVLGNIVANPAEPKFRKLRTSNAKISALLATKGVRAILLGVGFVEAGEFLEMPADAAVDAVQEGVTRLAQQVEDRAAGDSATKQAEIARRMDRAEKENEERARMKMQIKDDAAARQEPGWTAKAAGVKGGKAITSCSDIGIGNNSGG